MPSMDMQHGPSIRVSPQSTIPTTIIFTIHSTLFIPHTILVVVWFMSIIAVARAGKWYLSSHQYTYNLSIHCYTYLCIVHMYMPVKTNVFNTCVFCAYFDHWVTCPQLISFVTITHCIRMCVVYHSYSSPIRIYNL